MPRNTVDSISAQFLCRISQLSERQQLRLCCFLSYLLNGERIVALIEQARGPRSCPHCQHRQCHRFGKSNDLQRYRCLACKRTFNALTGTPLARLRHKNLWLTYCQCLLDAASTVRSAAQSAGVHRNTSFRWRHRFLDWVRRDRPATLQGIVEADTMRVRRSFKGARSRQGPPGQQGLPASAPALARDMVTVVVARDRAGRTIDFIAGAGVLKVRALTAQLLPRLERDVLLVSDARGPYSRFARAAGIARGTFDLRHGPRAGAHVHLDNVTAYQARFRQWLLHFRGVATRYLDSYLGWRWAIDKGRIGSAEQMLRAALGVFNGQR